MNIKLQIIEKLEAYAEAVWKNYGVPKKGEVLLHTAISMWSENDVAIESDGQGGAVLMIVEGNYPTDFIVHKTEKYHDTEDAFLEADKLIVSAC